MGDVTPWVIAAVPLVLIALVWFCAALAQLFEKAGEAGWQAWVPVRGAAVFLRLGGFRAWWLLLALLPVLGWIALGALTAVADRAVFSRGDIAPDEADRFWQIVHEERKALGAGRSGWARLLAAVSLRTFYGWTVSSPRSGAGSGEVA